MSRVVTLDTETTGIPWHQGDRVIEIGAVKLKNTATCIIMQISVYSSP